MRVIRGCRMIRARCSMSRAIQKKSVSSTMPRPKCSRASSSSKSFQAGKGREAVGVTKKFKLTAATAVFGVIGQG